MKDKRIRLIRRTPLQTALNERVDAWFSETGRNPRGGLRFGAKTALIFVWYGLSYGLVMSQVGGWWGLVAGALSFGFAIGGIGFCVMHDAGHKAVSHSARVNRWVFYSIELIGGSGYMWNQKHNVMHHTYPNVVGADDDLDTGGIARMAPEQKLLSHHRWQHLYMWPLYGFISMKWHWLDDWRQLATGRLLDHDLPRPRGRDLSDFLIGKVVFFGVVLIAPIIVIGFGKAVFFYVVSQFVLGVILAVVFQLAHCVEEASFLEVGDQHHELDYARLQVEASVDFAARNRLVTWYLGGLNFQAVHHLFPRVSHLHYPELAPIVAEVCAEYGVNYRSVPTMIEALGSHYRWLQRMGREPAPIPVEQAAAA